MSVFQVASGTHGRDRENAPDRSMNRGGDRVGDTLRSSVFPPPWLSELRFKRVRDQIVRIQIKNELLFLRDP